MFNRLLNAAHDQVWPRLRVNATRGEPTFISCECRQLAAYFPTEAARVGTECHAAVDASTNKGVRGNRVPRRRIYEARCAWDPSATPPPLRKARKSKPRGCGNRVPRRNRLQIARPRADKPIHEAPRLKIKSNTEEPSK